jgi:uncharacterized protein YegP (UPF0339 family)
MAGKFVLKRSGEQFMFNLLAAGNYEIIFTSERYTRASDARNGIAAVKSTAPLDAQYIKKLSVAGEPYFVLRAANNEVLGTSEMYSTSRACEEGIAAIKAYAPSATIEDRI